MASNTNIKELQGYITFLEKKVERLERKEKLSSSIYPHNAFISGDAIIFCYDESQCKPVGSTDKMIFDLKSIPLDKFKQFIKSRAEDLHLYSWHCMEGGDGYYGNTIDESLYNECFTIRLSECLHRMIESDNELKLSLMKKNYTEFYQRNR